MRYLILVLFLSAFVIQGASQAGSTRGSSKPSYLLKHARSKTGFW